MDHIPEPSILDPARAQRSDGSDGVTDHNPTKEELAAALRESCEYASQLWNELDATRRYLAESAPQNPRTIDGPVRTVARPSGPDDDDGWAHWTARYGSIITLMAGPRGDSGFGQEEAVREMRDRRLPPNVPRDEAPDPALDDPPAEDTGHDRPPVTDAAPPVPREAASGIDPPTAPPAIGSTTRTAGWSNDRSRTLFIAGLAVASLLTGRQWGRHTPGRVRSTRSG